MYVVLYSFIVLMYQRFCKAMLTARFDLDWAKAMSNKVRINEGLGLDRSCLWTQSNRYSTRTTDFSARLDLDCLKVVVKICWDKACKVIARFDLDRPCQVKSKSKSKTIMIRSKSSWIQQGYG